MRTWNLKADDPGEFTLASDVRTGKTNYTNDHIWELTLQGGEPPALAIRTSFGLRARNFRLFPRFVEGDTTVIDPTSFHQAPSIKKVYPNYLALSCAPLTGIDVQIEYWVPQSQVLAGRVEVVNSRLSARRIQVEWAGQLAPSAGGQPLAVQTMGNAPVLCGQTDGIYPLVFMTGGGKAGSGPYPALSLDMELPPGARRTFIWVQAALGQPQASFELAQQFAASSWDAEIARLDVLNAGLIEIYTGDPHWDAAFALAQKTAFRLLVGPTEHLPFPSFVLNRQPDQGFSPRGDGTDYNHLWSGQTPLDADYLCDFLLPAAPELAKGVFFNFLHRVKDQGFIDWKPGLGGQCTRLLATPILTRIAWRIYEVTEDQAFLEEVFPSLLQFVRAWFSNQQDRDGDGLPEWTRPEQAGFENHPIFSQWQPWAAGGDITKIESPSLCAFLFNEIHWLIKIAAVLEETSPAQALEALAENLRSAVQASWDESDASFKNWDRETHLTPPAEHLGDIYGSGEIQLEQDFPHAIRLLVRVSVTSELPHDIKVFIHGTGSSGNHIVEKVTSSQFEWHLKRGNASTERAFSAIERVKVTGLTSNDHLELTTTDLSRTDHTLFLPLWAQMIPAEQASSLVQRTITHPDRFWQPYGISACPPLEGPEDHPCHHIHMLWNRLIGEGLLAYGYQEETAELVKRLMSATVKNLITHKRFYHYYHASDGHGVGERNVLTGLAPLKLFLETLGVRLFSANKMLIWGKNPFPWPVTIRFRGLTIQRDHHKTTISFPGGQRAIVQTPRPRMITLETQ